MLVRYRHYTTQEMTGILARERIYFSRSHSVVRGLHKPDAIFLTVGSEISRENSMTVVVGCESYNNTDGIVELLARNGFDFDEATGRFVKLWTISYD